MTLKKKDHKAAENIHIHEVRQCIKKEETIDDKETDLHSEKKCWTSERMSKKEKKAVYLQHLSLQTHIFLQSDCKGTLCTVWSMAQLLSRDSFCAPLNLLCIPFNFPLSFSWHFLPYLRDIDTLFDILVFTFALYNHYYTPPAILGNNHYKRWWSSWMNQYFWTNELTEWFSDLKKTEAWQSLASFLN